MIGRWCAAAAAVIGVMVAGAPAAAAPPDFYLPPPGLPAGPAGDVIRAEPMPLVWQVGVPNMVTGAYFDPALPWTGPGPRPLVSMAAGTQGQGDQCAPSRTLGDVIRYVSPSETVTSYEMVFVNALLSQGIAVVITDYEGLGTPGTHSYVNRASEAHAVLDAARAAMRLPGTALRPHAPVGFWGYSHQTYPEARELIDSELNDRGRQMLADVQNQCVNETKATYGFQRTEAFTRTGEPLNPLPPINPGTGLNHALPYVFGVPESVTWMTDRFAGRPAPTTCRVP
ncbi:secretory lipase [Rhodococcus sp. AG1013]|uniref:lipase family protein n=1 Tax=Rhodococcus sp. AG1013 TaxID=2183996 RepID=UPI000E0C2944|nr:lipase family protein [Rhodococcus sp. AG1013]RDI30594.1 secretory lipase [Rhodococcus sp. AG1013]